MKITVKKKVETTEDIQIQLPYYCVHDLMSEYSDSIIYGKIQEDRHSKVHMKFYKG